ncbi:MAG: DoxX family protein [Deltaproteobacteria bacterium]|nr:DoxX family protein [Deltaproteobacteria bacterium]
MAAFMGNFEAQTYAALRIIAGLLFLAHGIQKLVGWPIGVPEGMMPDALRWTAGSIEMLGGLAIAVGFRTRWAAFVCSGMMAAAYWMAHGLAHWAPIVNQGELAVLYCFTFLYIAAKGPGIWSVDGGGR